MIGLPLSKINASAVCDKCRVGRFFVWSFASRELSPLLSTLSTPPPPPTSFAPKSPVDKVCADLERRLGNAVAVTVDVAVDLVLDLVFCECLGLRGDDGGVVFAVSVVKLID